MNDTATVSKPSDDAIDQRGDKDGDESVSGSVKSVHVHSGVHDEPIPAFLTDGPPAGDDLQARIAAAVKGISKSKPKQLPPSTPKPAGTDLLNDLMGRKPPALDNLRARVDSLDTIEADAPPPLPADPDELGPEIRFDGVEYERRDHLLPVLGYFHSVETLADRPESPEEANDALSRCCAIIALLHARMGDPGDMRGQIEFCIAGEVTNRDRLIDHLKEE